MSQLLKQVRLFAENAHDSINQRRKYTNEPYHVHPKRVAELVATVTNDIDIIATAWLHDVLEDVAPHNPVFNAAAIKKQFGERTLRLVLEVTDVSKPEDGNRAIRKSIDREHLAKASPEAMTVKLADMIDNVSDISQHDAHFSKVFKNEAKLILPHLKKGNADLYDRLNKLLNT